MSFFGPDSNREKKDPDDSGSLEHHATKGDVFNLMEEYRGFRLFSQSQCGGSTGYFRLSAARKELLVEVDRMQGFDDEIEDTELKKTLDYAKENIMDLTGVRVLFAVDDINLRDEVFDDAGDAGDYISESRYSDDGANPWHPDTPAYKKEYFLYLLFADRQRKSDLGPPNGINLGGGARASLVYCSGVDFLTQQKNPLVSLPEHLGFVAVHELLHSAGAKDDPRPINQYKCLEIKYVPLPDDASASVERGFIYDTYSDYNYQTGNPHIKLQQTPAGTFHSISLTTAAHDKVGELQQRIDGLANYSCNTLAGSGEYSFPLNTFLERRISKTNRPIILTHHWDKWMYRDNDVNQINAIKEPFITKDHIHRLDFKNLE